MSYQFDVHLHEASPEDRAVYDGIAEGYNKRFTEHAMKTAEQMARDLLERMEISGAQSFSAGELVELANVLHELAASSAREQQLRDVLRSVPGKYFSEYAYRAVMRDPANPVNAALALPYDDSILRAMIGVAKAKERERCATEAEVWGFGSDAAAAIRSLGDEE